MCHCNRCTTRREPPPGNFWEGIAHLDPFVKGWRELDKMRISQNIKGEETDV